MIRHSAEPSTFRGISRYFAHHLQMAPKVDVGEVHAQNTPHPLQITRELTNVMFDVHVGDSIAWWQSHARPNLPWAEAHFQERVSGEPLNPPPSHVDWPFAQAGNKQHIFDDQQFSHTYPERFWPRMANVGGKTREGRQVFVPHAGIRFLYGDLSDVVKLLQRNPMTRQAYLPIWFPEDLTAAAWARERVPCTLGYHFMYRGDKLHCTYFMRSCDFVRFFNDDVYMAGRLLQWVADQLGEVSVGQLTMHIVSLHCFEGDLAKIKRDYEL